MALVLQEGRIIIFASFVKFGFRFPESEFLADILDYFRVDGTLSP